MTSVPSHEIARCDLAALIEAKGATMECVPILARPNDDSEWGKTAAHRQCRIAFPDMPEPFIATYSGGSAVPIEWAKKHGPTALRRDIETASTNPRWQTLVCFEPLLARIRAAWRPSLVDVLSSCLMDSPEPGQPFEDWAVELGYDPDSRKAEAIFRECEKVGAYMRRAFGADFGRAQELAREM